MLPALPSLCQVSDLSSPCHNAPNVNFLAVPGGVQLHLHPPPVAFLDGKVSTPNVMQHCAVVASFEHCLTDVSAFQPPWDLSLIKADSPQLHPAAPLAMLEIPSPIWKDASPNGRSNTNW